MLCLQCSLGGAPDPALPVSVSLWAVTFWWSEKCVTSCFYKTDALVSQGSACEVGNDSWMLNLASKVHIFSWLLPGVPAGMRCVCACACMHIFFFNPEIQRRGWGGEEKEGQVVRKEWWLYRKPQIKCRQQKLKLVSTVKEKNRVCTVLSVNWVQELKTGVRGAAYFCLWTLPPTALASYPPNAGSAA